APGSLLPANQGRGSVQAPHKPKVFRSVEAPSLSSTHRRVSSNPRCFDFAVDREWGRLLGIDLRRAASLIPGRAGAERTQGHRVYVALERGKQLECKEPDVRRHITGLATLGRPRRPADHPTL